jgi:1-deoxy-D-xylulose-5-phosphate synthase
MFTDVSQNADAATENVVETVMNKAETNNALGNPTSLLDTIESPQDVRALPREALPKLVEELRAFVLKTVSQTGGHLSSNLGVIELTVALHYAFNTPDDRIIWDVGHQTYAHKALTGRRARLHTLRQKGGLSGFPSRAESEYDAFGTAHSSTSISAALGMAVAAQAGGSSRRVVAVIGDGAMSGGMAFEALNNAGAMDANLLVILNDNEMSISKPVGAFHQHLAQILTSPLYNSVRESGKDILAKFPPMKRFAKQVEEHTKGMLMPSTLFEEFGFFYVGPINGHDIDTLAKTLVNMRDLKGPRLLHIVTEKGHGYAPAEQDPILYHGVGRFDPNEGIVPQAMVCPTYTEVFGQWLCDMARADERLVAITPAMCEGSGLTEFAREFPQRYFDVGIAEQHAVTFAAGLACDGLKPVVAIYSTFLQRAYDQLVHDVVLQNLPVVFAIDRAGIVGADGPTHIGAFDLSFMRCLPNLTIMAPSDEAECRAMLTTAFRMETPTAVRYPRGTGTGITIPSTLETIPVGRGEIRRRATNGGDKSGDKKIALLVFGIPLTNALTAAETLDATVANMRFVKPLDTALIEELANTHDALITLEENAVMGGAGAAIAEFLTNTGIVKPILHLGLPDHFVEHGAPEELLAQCGLDAAGIVRQIQEWQARLPERSRFGTQENS